MPCWNWKRDCEQDWTGNAPGLGLLVHLSLPACRPAAKPLMLAGWKIPDRLPCEEVWRSQLLPTGLLGLGLGPRKEREGSNVREPANQLQVSVCLSRRLRLLSVEIRQVRSTAVSHSRWRCPGGARRLAAGGRPGANESGLDRTGLSY